MNNRIPWFLIIATLPFCCGIMAGDGVSNAATQPSIITLHYTDTPALKVLQDIEKQSSADLGANRQDVQAWVRGKNISIDLDHASFWEALVAIRKLTDLSVNQNELGPMVLGHHIGAEADFTLPGITVGVFRVVPTRPKRSRRYDFDKGWQYLIAMGVDLMAEPKLQILGKASDHWLVTCQDDRGNELVPVQIQEESRNGNGWDRGAGATFNDGPGLGNKIALLKGDIKYVVVAKSESIEIDDLSKLVGLQRKVGGMSMLINQFSKVGKQWHLEMTFTGALLEDTWSFSIQYQYANEMASYIRLMDQNGNPMQAVEVNGGGDDERQHKLNLAFDFTGPPAAIPARFEWPWPTEVQVIDVPFEFYNLELPPRK